MAAVDDKKYRISGIPHIFITKPNASRKFPSYKGEGEGEREERGGDGGE